MSFKVTSGPALTPAASICLLHKPSRSVLLGRRLVGPWPGYWSFPGGRIEDGESALEAALRELEEETAIVLASAAAPLLETQVRVEFGERRYAITNFVVAARELYVGSTTIELEPRWVTLEKIAAVGAIAKGTQTIIDRVRTLAGS